MRRSYRHYDGYCGRCGQGVNTFRTTTLFFAGPGRRPNIEVCKACIESFDDWLDAAFPEWLEATTAARRKTED